MKNLPLHLTCLLSSALLFTVAGCKPKTAGQSDIFAGNGERSVHALVDGPAFVQPQPDRLIVNVPSHQIVIEKERLLVDKAERAKVPADAKKFEVNFAKEILTVTADGAEILQTPLKK